MILSLVDTEMGPYLRTVVRAERQPNVHLTLGPSPRGWGVATTAVHFCS